MFKEGIANENLTAKQKQLLLDPKDEELSFNKMLNESWVK